MSDTIPLVLAMPENQDDDEGLSPLHSLIQSAADHNNPATRK